MIGVDTLYIVVNVSKTLGASNNYMYIPNRGLTCIFQSLSPIYRSLEHVVIASIFYLKF